ncbi:MAG TPA: carboxylesterase family protein [Silvibacterium sp.]|nr:carboxylesterase family protein [Silvibacterium sp.]
MHRTIHWFMACSVVLTMIGVSPANAQDDPSRPLVTLNAGTVQGQRVTGREMAFLGIPYAAPPVGALRWKPPQPAAAWSGTRKAAQFGPACPQLPAGWLPYPVWSEDCLYLNIWTTSLSPQARLPVIVYFHGGSNRAGHSQLTPLGPSLSPMGVVLVTANYRLGPLGFFAHPALTAESPHRSSGNYGLLDQMQVLRWVRRNIERFGGDPQQVTAMGQSAGAFDICLLMASPLARGLFQKAIMESGDCTGSLIEDIHTPIHYSEIAGTGEGNGQRFAADLGIADGPNASRRLRGIPVDRILKTWSRDPQIQFDAIVDGWVIPTQPAKVFGEGRQARIPVLVGSNADEATVLGHGPATIAEYRKYLEEDTGPYAQQEFCAWPVGSDAQVPDEYLKLQSDTFAYGAWSMARSVTRAGEAAYLYLFTWAETGKRARLGAYHGEELTFLSNTFPHNWGPSNGDQAFGEAVRTYWTQFAKTGSPNHPGAPLWRAYNPRPDQVLNLGREIRMVPVNSKLHVLEKIMAPILSNSPSLSSCSGSAQCLIASIPDQGWRHRRDVNGCIALP